MIHPEQLQVDHNKMDIRIHKILIGSRANGPGVRNVVWFQGCTLNCPGCFNTQTHDPAGGQLISSEHLCDMLLDPERTCDGITISGGEPFQQPEELFTLLSSLRKRKSPPILVFSGLSYTQLDSNHKFKICLPLIDALICGPYDKERPPAYERFCSSANQELWLLSNRFRKDDFKGLQLSEIIIDETGNAVFSGIKLL